MTTLQSQILFLHLNLSALPQYYSFYMMYDVESPSNSVLGLALMDKPSLVKINKLMDY